MLRHMRENKNQSHSDLYYFPVPSAEGPDHKGCLYKLQQIPNTGEQEPADDSSLATEVAQGYNRHNNNGFLYKHQGIPTAQLANEEENPDGDQSLATDPAQGYNHHSNKADDDSLPLMVFQTMNSSTASLEEGEIIDDETRSTDHQT